MATLLLFAEDLVNSEEKPTINNIRLSSEVIEQVDVILYSTGNETLILKNRFGKCDK